MLIKKKSAKKTISSHKGYGTPKVATHFHLRILSRHPSTKKLRGKILLKGIKVVYRHGSTTQGSFKYEINSVESVKNSSDKKRMKECFDKAKISQAIWKNLPAMSDKKVQQTFLKEVNFPENHLIIKSRFGSRGNGNTLIKTQAELDSFIKTRSSSLDRYIIEEYKSYLLEFRIHVSKDGCFYTCRKALKKDAPEKSKFQRHDDNCVWILETNPDFNKPSNWSAIVQDCVKALRAIGGDVLAFDVKTTSPKNSKEKDKSVRWIIIESCSAPSFGDVTAEKYIENFPRIIKSKYNV